MNYTEAVDYIENLEKFGSVYGLDTIRTLLNRLGNPQQSLKFIHVAGTNGKGSVCAYLTKILQVSGYKVGTFNSPSVFIYNERFLINSKPIDDESVSRLISLVVDERNKMEKEGIKNLPTAFEIEVAVAMLLFKEQQCDIVVLETGMGGRLDATNVIEDKICAVITSISLEHTQYLGNTLHAIATEKFGIVKDTLVTFEQAPEIMDVFKQAKHLYIAGEAQLQIANLSGLTFTYKRQVYKTTMLGEYQLQNAALAIATVKVLKKNGFVITKENLKKGIFLAQWAGRCEKLYCKDELVLIDGAHNPNGAKTLHDSLNLHFNGIKKTFVFGVFKDKDINGILYNVKGEADTIRIATPPTKRGLDLDSMKPICEKYFKNVIPETSISTAIEHALEDDTQMVVVFGSLSILKEAKNFVRGYNEQGKN